MNHLFKNPSWIDARLIEEQKLEQIPDSLFDDINQGLTVLQSDKPLVSVVVPAYNEEFSILRTLYSLSCNKTSFPTEIIVVNNNSTDRTQEVLDRLNVRTFFQPKQGWGPARQMGQEKARGKYILMADADCFYPPDWIDSMTAALECEGVTCVYGGFSFLGSQGKPRWKFSLYELLRGLVSEVRQFRRPWLNVVGMSMGYVRELGLKKGFVSYKIRGEDGRMCFELMQHGKIKRLRSSDVVVWTFPRTLQKDGNLLVSVLNRALIELYRFKTYFVKLPAHDTHASKNFEAPTIEELKGIGSSIQKKKIRAEVNL